MHIQCIGFKSELFRLLGGKCCQVGRHRIVPIEVMVFLIVKRRQICASTRLQTKNCTILTKNFRGRGNQLGGGVIPGFPLSLHDCLL